MPATFDRSLNGTLFSGEILWAHIRRIAGHRIGSALSAAGLKNSPITPPCGWKRYAVPSVRAPEANNTPMGAFRRSEDWSAFNTALNVGLAYSLLDKTKSTFGDANFTKPFPILKSVPQKIGIELKAPLSTMSEIAAEAYIELLVAGKAPQRIALKRSSTDGVRFRGTAETPPKGEIRAVYGWGMMQKVARWK